MATGLEDYWGVGPKTAALLREELGEEAAIEAIEAADVRALVDAGLGDGRATRILRHADGGAGLDVLATGDARAVYRDVLDYAGEYAVTDRAADRVRVLTPLTSRAAMVERLDDVMAAVASWRALDEATREAVLDAFADHDSRRRNGDDDSPDPRVRSAVETALALRAAGVDSGVFAPVDALDGDDLSRAATALAALAGDVADDELARLDASLGAVEDMASNPGPVVDAVTSEARGPEGFRDALGDHVANETELSRAEVREAMPTEATDATDFVTATLRTLAEDLRERTSERRADLRAEHEAAVEGTNDTVGAAVEAVETVAFEVSLARFADAFDLSRPDIVDGEVLAVEGARNLGLVAADEAVQPVDYALGEHDLGPPSGDRVAVLTGANSGGKTTLLETLCQTALLAQMGLPVPADEATVGVADSVVFHRRHASFNAGVLESTLRSVVPPVAENEHTLMLVDEFEAITEPGAAADLLHGLVTLTVEREALGVYVTHLAEDLEPLPEVARTDGIFAEGLTTDLELDVDYQPRFDTLGRSTPEFIVSRLVAEADGRGERAAFQHLAEAVGKEAVQRTLSDAKWTEG